MNRLILNIPKEDKNLPLMDIMFLHNERKGSEVTISGKIYFNGEPGEKVIKEEIEECWLLLDGVKRSLLTNFQILSITSSPYYDFQAKGLTHYLF